MTHTQIDNPKDQTHIAKILEDAKDRKQVCDELCQRAGHVAEELEAGLRHVANQKKSVTFWGSARFTEENVHYKQARRLAARLAELDFAIVTGGGPGIMEAANRGAQDVGGTSIGLNIQLPMEQHVNEYVTESFGFHYFFTRKVSMAYAAEAYIYFPGGFGTLDEFFEIVTLIQTRKVPKVPIFLVGADYWQPLDTMIRDTLLEKHKSISPEDLDLYTITDDEDEVIKGIQSAQVIEKG